MSCYVKKVIIYVQKLRICTKNYALLFCIVRLTVAWKKLQTAIRSPIVPMYVFSIFILHVMFPS